MRDRVKQLKREARSISKYFGEKFGDEEDMIQMTDEDLRHLGWSDKEDKMAQRLWDIGHELYLLKQTPR